jgi:hypothetical protein
VFVRCGQILATISANKKQEELPVSKSVRKQQKIALITSAENVIHQKPQNASSWTSTSFKHAGVIADSLTGIRKALVECFSFVIKSCTHKGF